MCSMGEGPGLPGLAEHPIGTDTSAGDNGV